ncbi:hypothetical protein TRFO_41500 [Tritrichomonas foetus]|uniref:Uncharacterized protein n=1 Tax=Tritrichomonas foetus TaxID=1144522 RepID=A0A1J4L1B5_9EUKA|nr:hypothetical protein TRFO_41500 [Tritrichomonas foetus]|eukprot:OHT16872.1 hypothetical protein TRFO_41500 [Tritrichomonas foetus]
MDLENAIKNLTIFDETIRSTAIEICSAFQTLEGFDCDIFQKLSSRDSDQSSRYFAYNSLIAVIKKHWNEIQAPLKDSIISLFPFHSSEDITDPIYYAIVSKSAAAYFAYLGSESEINTFVEVYTPIHFKYFASFLTFFITFLFEETFPAERTAILSKFIFENVVKFTKVLLFNPLLQIPPDSPDFNFILDCIATVHEVAPVIIQLFIRDTESETFYSYLSQFVWLPSETGSLLTIFEILFENLTNLPETIQNLAYSLQLSIPSNYSPLFSFDPIPETEYANCYYLFNNLLIRIPLIINILNSANMNQYGFFLEACISLFKSSSPSIVFETANHLLTFLKSIQNPNIQVFYDLYESHIRAILEVSLPLLQVSFGSSPCIIFDHRWTQQSCRSSIMDLTRCIIEMFDSLHMVSELIKLIQIDGVESSSFHAIVRILINILGDPNEKMKGLICEDAFNCTIFLLSSINLYTPQLQNKICKLLMKFIPYLEFDQINLNAFFSQLLNLFLNARPAAFDPFTNFFNQFTHMYGDRIEFPVERLKQIPKNHPCYYTVLSLMAKYAPVSEDITVLNNALNELNWFTTSFKPNENSSMRRVTTRLARQFEYLSQINPSDAGMQPSPIYDKISILLINSNQILLNAGEDPANGIPLGQYLTLLTQFAPAIAHFAKIGPQQYISMLHELRPPSVFSQAVPQWVTRIALPIVNELYKTQAPSVLDFTARVIHKMCELVEAAFDSCENSSDTAGIVKKLIISICDFTQFVSDEQAIEALAVCLKYDNFKTFYAVAHAIEEKGVNVLSALWPNLMKRKDNQSVDRMSEVLLALYEKNGLSSSIFAQLPGISQQTLDTLNSKLPNSTAPKTRKRIIRSFIMNYE